MASSFADIGRELLLSTTLSDVTLVIRDTTLSYPAHSLVLACRSKVLQSMLSSPTSSSTPRCEPTALVLPLEPMSDTTARQLLTYIYTDSLPTIDASSVPAHAFELLLALARYHLFSAFNQHLQTISEALLCADGVCGLLDQVHRAVAALESTTASRHSTSIDCIAAVRALEQQAVQYACANAPLVLRSLEFAALSTYNVRQLLVRSDFVAPEV
jgi:hypothetical protein